MTGTMQRVVLARRPQGAPVAEDFRLEELAMPQPGAGEVLVKVGYLSLDPYMRGRMDDAKSYAKPVGLGETMEGGAVGQVIASQAPGLAPGDWVFGGFGWASHGVQPAKAVRRLDPAAAPVSTALGVLGMPGFTGWFGLTELGRPQKGETLVVAAATGPVGSMVGQLAQAARAARGGHRRRRRQMPAGGRGIRLRRLHRPSRQGFQGAGGGARHRLPGRDRHLFRECRRRGAERGAGADECRRADPGLRRDRLVRPAGHGPRRWRGARHAAPRLAHRAGQPAAGLGLHHLGQLGPVPGIPGRSRAAWSPMAASATARMWPRGWRMPPPPSWRC